MALTWTSVEDVKSRWIGGEDVPATDTQIAALLEDAEDTILHEFPTIQTRIDDLTLPIRRVQKVAARVVIRHLRNPGGIRSTQMGAGPFQETRTYGGDEPGAFYLSDEDRAELGGLYDGAAFTIDATPLATLTEGVWTSGDVWEPLS